MLTKTFSPKELADVIGVSESSVKRWSDAGLIGTTRTAGGHRRIAFSEAARFIRERQMRVVRPDLFGLPDLAAPPAGALTEEMLYRWLEAGEAAQARRALAAAYLAGADLARLFDGPVAGALQRFGTLWREDERGIFLEHVATHLCIEAVNAARLLLPAPPDDAPVALGGAPEDDPYLLPGLMTAAVLAEAGYATVNLGPQTPAASLRHAVATHRPRLVWLAVTADLSETGRDALIEEVAAPLREQAIDVVIGGQGALPHADAWPPSVHVLPSMEELAAFARARRVGLA